MMKRRHHLENRNGEVALETMGRPMVMATVVTMKIVIGGGDVSAVSAADTAAEEIATTQTNPRLIAGPDLHPEGVANLGTKSRRS